MSVTPPPFQSNYPRGPQQPGLGYLRPPGVYFDAISSAWEMVKADFGTYVVCALILVGAAIAIVMAASMLGFATGFATMYQPGSKPSASIHAMQFVSQIVSSLINQFLVLGLVSVGIGHLQRGRPQISDMFVPLRRLDRSIPAVLILEIPQLLMALVTLATPMVTDPRDLDTAFVGLAGVGAISLLMWVTIMGPLLVGGTAAIWSNYPPMAAFGEAFRRIGWKAPLLSLLLLLSYICAGLGVCGCIIGVLFTLPIATNVIALHYAYFFPPAERDGMPANPYFPQP